MPFSDSVFPEARARRALAFAGLPSQVAVTRADSVTNEVHLTDQYVIRVNRKPTGRLEREAELCARLPGRPWAPQVVAHGYQGGLDYLIAARRPGATLSRWWPWMNAAQREDATRQLGAVLLELHSLPCPPEVPDLDTNPQLVDLRTPAPLLPIFAALDRLRIRPDIDPGLLRTAEELLVASGEAVIDGQPTGLVHGDLSFENVMWDGTALTGLLDFEWSRTAPADLDLDVLLRFCAFPSVHLPADRAGDARAGDYAQLPGWLRVAYPALFSHPRLLERLRVYALGFDVRELLITGPAGPAHTLYPLHPTRRLRQLLDGLCYLDQLWEHHLR
jgi:hygromycin-B 7''-O-kinase